MVHGTSYKHCAWYLLLQTWFGIIIVMQCDLQLAALINPLMKGSINLWSHPFVMAVTQRDDKLLHKLSIDVHVYSKCLVVAIVIRWTCNFASDISLASHIIMQACILIVSAAEMKKQLIAFVIDYNNLNIQEKIAKGS